MLDIPGTDQLDPLPQAAHATRKAIDGILSETTNSDVRRQLTEARGLLDTELKKIPGFKQADARFSDVATQADNYELGRTLLESGRNAPTPAKVAALASDPKARLRLSQGTRAEIDRIVGQNANDRVALQRLVKGEGDWNPQKLSSLFGKDKTDRIMKVLKNEAEFDISSNRIIKNSATAERLEPGSGMSPVDALKAGGFTGMARGYAVDVLDKLTKTLRSTKGDANMAKMLTSSKDAVAALEKIGTGAKSPAARQLAALLLPVFAQIRPPVNN
jgi:hypothetical protein